MALDYFIFGIVIGANLMLYWVSPFWGGVYTIVALLLIWITRRGMLLPVLLGLFIGFS